MKRRYTQHGMTHTKLYQVWKTMIQRCHNPDDKAYRNYGARGIDVCQRWRDNFLNFLSDMGPRPDRHTIERIDNDLGYCPENCRWAPQSVQNRNKRNNVVVEFGGDRLCLTDMAHKYGHALETVYNRLLDGWSLERALLTPHRGFMYGDGDLVGGASYRGVSRKRNKFRARIKLNGKHVQIGTFWTQEEAAMAYRNVLESHLSAAKVSNDDVAPSLPYVE